MPDGTPPGSSPLTRGKHGREFRGSGVARLIPAHAGKTGRQRSDLLCSPAHPRSRGENARAIHMSVAATGSSPLTRGKRLGEVPEELLRRLIPAHAGKTTWSASSTWTSSAHPRSRGENRLHIVRPLSSVGSSPLTRGKPPVAAAPHRRWRLIPAHAGKTPTSTVSRSAVGAHPRSRGENSATAPAVTPHVGSSPLTRGKPRRIFRRDRRPGLIPAHAGKTR